MGYNFVVGEDGNIYEGLLFWKRFVKRMKYKNIIFSQILGRGWSNMGAHAPGYNNQSIGLRFSVLNKFIFNNLKV